MRLILPVLALTSLTFAQVSQPSGGSLKASSTKSVHFRIVFHDSKPVTSGTLEFRGTTATCGISITLSSKSAQATCFKLRNQSIQSLPSGDMELTANISFLPTAFPKRQKLQLFTAANSTPLVQTADFTLDPPDPAAPALAITVSGVTPTQAALTFTPPDPAQSCTVAVTSFITSSGADYSHLVPDTDPDTFPSADSADPYDATNAPLNRAVVNTSGSRTVVIGKRSADYSPYAFKRVSRALRALTPHQAFIACGDSSGIINFTTANIMPGVTYTDPIPSDPNAPGVYAYPTMSWTNRNETVIDPHSGLALTHVSMPGDLNYNDLTKETIGLFAAPIRSDPSAPGPSSLFLPANISPQTPNWYYPILNSFEGSYSSTDLALSSLLPKAFNIVSRSPVSVCLTADGVTCAVDVNMASDPNAPNGGALGITIPCSGSCAFPASDPRWSDSTAVLKAWHPNYSPDLELTIVPNFQIDSIKTRKTQITCDGSPTIKRALDPNGNGLGPTFSVVWSSGTPLQIGSTTFYLKNVIDQDTAVLRSSCPQSASTQDLTASTFGLLIQSTTGITSVGSASWRMRMHTSGGYGWDAAGDVETSTNCSRQPVSVNGVPGWHCSFGPSAYWIAADGSKSLPMGLLGLPYNPTSYGSNPYCSAALWDNRDGNTVYCFAYALASTKDYLVAAMTFRGNHSGLEQGTFNSPEVGGPGYLPTCSSSVTNNCWNIKVLTAAGSSTPFLLSSAVKDFAPNIWNSSAFKNGGASAQGASRVGDDYLTYRVGFSQDAYAFMGILQLSNPRGTVSLKRAISSWAGDPSLPIPANGGPRWGGIHNPSIAGWGGSKITMATTFFRGGGTTGNGPYFSDIVSQTNLTCPGGIPATCIQFTINGHPSNPSHSSIEPVNDQKTGRPGAAYLQDLAPGDLLCAPKDNEYGLCINNHVSRPFEFFKVLSISTQTGSSALQITVQRNYGGTSNGIWAAGQNLFAMPSSCTFEGSIACGGGGSSYDLDKGTFESFDVGGCCHQFQAPDPVHSQVVLINAVAIYPLADYCNSPPALQANCYNALTGILDSTKPLTAQVPFGLAKLQIPTAPPFAGLSGYGSPNPVDTHPGGFHIPLASDQDKTWFVDGRPFLGLDFQFNSPLSVSGFQNVYRYPVYGDPDASVSAYKTLPPIAYCGLQLLHEVTQISDSTPYSYCVAVSGDDCVSGSMPGEGFLSCPAVNPAAAPGRSCLYPGIAKSTPEFRDSCLTLSSQYTMNLTQVAFATQKNGILSPLKSDKIIRSGRSLTNGFVRYRNADDFWNPKTTPDGKVLLFRTNFLNGYSTQIMMAPLPAFPDLSKDNVDRATYIPTPANLLVVPDGTVSAKVRFGYNPGFNCTARPEPCEARNDLDPSNLANPFYFASEAGSAIDCSSNGCPVTINLPGISQRVMYYQAIYADANGVQTTGPIQVAVIP